MTTLLGFLTAWVGLGVQRVAERWAEPIGGWLLLGFGLLYLAVDLRHLGHRHSMDVDFSEAAAVFTFVLMLAISPCVALLPVFFAAGATGWQGVALIALVNVVVTVPMMAGMVWLASSGLERIKLTLLQRHERTLVGVVIAALGLGVLLWEHH
jgi:putative Mn2+ efflux pump MntP